jgi:hypothetical protein
MIDSEINNLNFIDDDERMCKKLPLKIIRKHTILRVNILTKFTNP